MPKTFQKIVVNTVIFDLDGTLIDSIGPYFEGLAIAFKNLALPLPSRKAVSDAVNNGEFNWDRVLPNANKNQKNEYIITIRTVVEQFMAQNDLKLIPGANKILREISAQGLKIGIVTSTLKKNIKNKIDPLKKANIDDLIEVIITIDDAQRKKPAADPLIECAKRLGVDADNCVYLGDSRIDIMAGRAAGMKTVGVLTGLDDYDSLMEEGPDMVINSLVDLHITSYGLRVSL